MSTSSFTPETILRDEKAIGLAKKCNAAHFNLNTCGALAVSQVQGEYIDAYQALIGYLGTLQVFHNTATGTVEDGGLLIQLPDFHVARLLIQSVTSNATAA